MSLSMTPLDFGVHVALESQRFRCDLLSWTPTDSAILVLYLDNERGGIIIIDRSIDRIIGSGIRSIQSFNLSVTDTSAASGTKLMKGVNFRRFLSTTSYISYFMWENKFCINHQNDCFMPLMVRHRNIKKSLECFALLITLLNDGCSMALSRSWIFEKTNFQHSLGSRNSFQIFSSVVLIERFRYSEFKL